ncbi:hypothetical protein AB0N05_11325 [Nocardia sp. NPDC051030]|uniref:hypothetical protein n=1 Tax=Nocardia sp. NPDC051030 TaxID=3155162 RepID=UPI00343A97ED
MAIDASYQALPYGPLIERAMHDQNTAEALQFFDTLATVDIALTPYRDDPLWLELAPIARQLASERPGLLERALVTRSWDAAYWMLAPNRRAQADRNPDGLAEIAVFGAEQYPCKAVATQGIPYRLVRPDTAAAVAHYIENMLAGAPALFDVQAMEAAQVYKLPHDRDDVLNLLDDYARLYRQAAEMDEWVLVTRD